MKKGLFTAISLLMAVPALAQDFPARAQSSIMFQLFRANHTIAEAGELQIAVVYNSDNGAAEAINDALSGRGLNTTVMTVDDFESNPSDYQAAYFTPDAEPNPEITSGNGVLSIGLNQTHFDDGNLSICLTADEEGQVAIHVNRNKLDAEEHVLADQFFDMPVVQVVE